MSRTESLSLDLSVGETELVASTLGLDSLVYQSTPNSRGYQPVGGRADIVSYLEKKYSKYVVVSAGAKQSVHAALHYMEFSGKKTLNRQEPHWSVFNKTFSLYPFSISSSFDRNPDSFNFIVSPNNPDGKIFSSTIENYTIHDAVYNLDYYTDHVLNNIGDIEIYSFSKMLGISGARVGFCLTSSLEARDYISNYIEEMTVGVSAASQIMALNGLKILENTDMSIVKTTLLSNKLRLIQSLKDYGEFKLTDGIFLYGKLHRELPKEITVAHYPDSFIRINTCVLPETINSVVEILNNHD